MFTGIVEEVGTILNISKGVNSARLSIECSKVLEGTNVGDSIAVNGVCLTVTHLGENYFNADIMHETLNKSSLKNISSKSPVNLERAMAVNSRFGGHIVSGHIDGTGKIMETTKDDNAIWYKISASPNILKYIVNKGSITIDGISLTVADITNMDFSISAIPHSIENTILKYKNIGDMVNLEVDIIGKYVEKLLNFNSTKNKETNITKDFLLKHGF